MAAAPAAGAGVCLQPASNVHPSPALHTIQREYFKQTSLPGSLGFPSGTPRHFHGSICPMTKPQAQDMSPASRLCLDGNSRHRSAQTDPRILPRHPWLHRRQSVDLGCGLCMVRFRIAGRNSVSRRIPAICSRDFLLALSVKRKRIEIRSRIPRIHAFHALQPAHHQVGERCGHHLVHHLESIR